MSEEKKNKFLEAINSTSPIEFERFLKEYGYIKKLNNFQDIWFNDMQPYSYWVLLISGLNDSKEKELAHTILTWSELKGKNQAMVRCIQSSDQDRFDFCNSYFENSNYPVLFISNEFDFKTTIKIKSQTLMKLHSKENEFERFLVKIHSLLRAKQDVKEVQKNLDKASFWEMFKVGFKEAKSLFSITINN